MTQDEIIEMARQVGIRETVIQFHKLEIEAFAKLVRNHYSYTHAHLWLTRIEGAVKAEREACAKVCEELVIEVVGNSALAVDQCTRAIRARGQA